jgi:hypothetical protein
LTLVSGQGLVVGGQVVPLTVSRESDRAAGIADCGQRTLAALAVSRKEGKTGFGVAKDLGFWYKLVLALRACEEICSGASHSD